MATGTYMHLQEDKESPHQLASIVNGSRITRLVYKYCLFYAWFSGVGIIIIVLFGMASQILISFWF